MKRFSERKRSAVVVVVCLILLLIMGYIERGMADTIVVVPTDGDQQRDSSTVIVDQKDGGQKMIHCLSTETGLIYCMEL